MILRGASCIQSKAQLETSGDTISTFSFRLTEVSHALTTAQKQRDIEMKELKATTKELVNVSDGEKQRIVMQISAVQTDMQANLEKRSVT